MKRICAAMAATVVLLSAAGCGGGGRPSNDEVSEVFQKGGEIGGQEFKLEKAQADCVAKVFVDSDLSDDALNALVDDGADAKVESKDNDVLRGLTTKIATCVTPKS